MPDAGAPGQALKASEFNIFVPSDFEDVVLIFNTATGAYAPVDLEQFSLVAALIDNSGQIDAANRSELLEAGILVPEDLDERARIKQRYFEGRQSETGLNLTIAPTVSCNFACSYCFEEHPKRHLSDADIAAMADYVRNGLEPGAPLDVTWFGGEPLAAFRQLKQLDAALQDVADEKGSTYTQFIITNGSLLTEAKVEYFASRPHFTGAQITLDGPADVHDQRRFSSAGKPTFAKILTNLKAIKGRIDVSLRVNLDKQNVNRIHELIDLILAEDMGHYIHMYFGHVVDYTDECGDLDDTMLSREEFAAAEVRLFNLMIQKGLRPGFGLPQPRAGSLCVGDAPGGAVLSPGGLVFKCWNETALPEADAYARLGEGGVVTRNAVKESRDQFWNAYDPFTHSECETCAVQPLCKGGCPWEAEKRPTNGPGHCTPLRYNLPDILRLHHLRSSIDALSDEASIPRPRQTV